MSPLSLATHLGQENFLAGVLHRRHLHIPGAVSAPQNLLTWDQVNDIISTHRLEPPRMRLMVGGEMVPLHRYTEAVTTRRNTVWHRVHPAQLHECLDEGASLVLDSMDEISQPIGSLAVELERLLRAPVQTNVYASVRALPGFKIHWDAHDVIVIQLDGKKHWKIYGPTRPAPLYRDVADPEEPAEPPLDEVVLEPGDLLYVPRGWWHSVAATEGTPSLHATFGLRPATGAQLLEWIADALREEEVFRLDLPIHDSAADQQEHLRDLGARVAQMFADPRLLHRFAEERDSTSLNRLRTSLPYVSDIPSDPELRVRLLTATPLLDTSRPDDVIVFRACGKEWEMSIEARPLLQALIDTGPHSVSLGELADSSGLGLSDVAMVVSDLVRGQAASAGRSLP
ncbi:cupin domain-containing protein [Streptomyces sp. NPDC006798]|uniref:cupin domain-containing protein n=1 Tax=Streptomyces sp. NPDC006798 TaxID=3155462 RepID=UPI0033FA10C8